MINIEILNIKDKEEPLLERKRIDAEISCPKVATPSMDDVKKVISDKYGIGKDHLIVNRIDHRFGRDKVKVVAFLYKSKEKVTLIERRFMVKKQTAKKERKVETRAEEKK